MIRRLLAVLALAAAVPGILIAMVIPASAGVRYGASPARATPLPVLYNLGGGSGSVWNLAQRRPVVFYLTADGLALLGDNAHHLKWTKWTMTSAAATGRLLLPDWPVLYVQFRSSGDHREPRPAECDHELV